jgi:hypothetical protein
MMKRILRFTGVAGGLIPDSDSRFVSFETTKALRALRITENLEN